jgi:hypothetical protein
MYVISFVGYNIVRKIQYCKLRMIVLYRWIVQYRRWLARIQMYQFRAMSLAVPAPSESPHFNSNVTRVLAPGEPMTSGVISDKLWHGTARAKSPSHPNLNRPGRRRAAWQCVPVLQHCCCTVSSESRGTPGSGSGWPRDEPERHAVTVSESVKTFLSESVETLSEIPSLSTPCPSL